jgi:DMSO/TMAO reductase YedYZ heme-binding membrane subunit
VVAVAPIVERSRWRPTAVLAAVAAVVAIAPLAGGVDEQALRVAIRGTAGVAVVAFCMVFAASSLNALVKAEWTKWLMRHRRALGVGFAAMQGIHLLVVLALASQYTERFWSTTPITSIVGGGVGYLWLAAMTITSFDATARAIGRRAWTILHTSGVYSIWAIFAASYLGQPRSSWRLVAVDALLLAALGLRIVARVRRWARGS